jgi:hypothetical protein
MPLQPRHLDRFDVEMRNPDIDRGHGISPSRRASQAPATTAAPRAG